MRIIVTGGTGFIGQALVPLLAEGGFEVVVAGRDAVKAARLFGELAQGVTWDTGKPAGGEEFAAAVDGAHGVVNLAGASVFTRWTREARRKILESRVQAGAAVTQAVERAVVKPAVVVQGSAVGYYGYDHGDEALTEDSPSGEGFLADVCRQWEPSTQLVEEMGVRRAVARTGVVLGGEGGALAAMLPAFKLFAGGHPGSGNQYMSWIARQDEAAALRFLLEKQDAAGPFNLTAPNPVPMRQFCAGLGRELGRPSWAHPPGALLRMAMGDMAREMLLGGQRAMPVRLQEAGYIFLLPDVEKAFSSILEG